MAVLSSINFEFVSLNHQFPEDFNFRPLRSPRGARGEQRLAVAPDGDEDALTDVALDELS